VSHDDTIGGAEPSGGNDLSYDELLYADAPTGTSQVLTGLVVLLITVLGAPQVWDLLQRGRFGPALVFYPVLAVALGSTVVGARRS
jgi:hypothetical protein